MAGVRGFTMKNIPDLEKLGDAAEVSEDFGIGLTSERASQLDAIRAPLVGLAAATDELVARSILPSLSIALGDYGVVSTPLRAPFAVSQTSPEVAPAPRVAGAASLEENPGVGNSKSISGGFRTPDPQPELRPGQPPSPMPPSREELAARGLEATDRVRRSPERALSDWDAEQREIRAVARAVVDTVRNSNGMLDAEQIALLDATLYPRLLGARDDGASIGSRGFHKMQKIQEAVNDQLIPKGYSMAFYALKGQGHELSFRRRVSSDPGQPWQSIHTMRAGFVR